MAIPQKLRRRFPVRRGAPRATLISSELVNHVADALCREWEGVQNGRHQRDAQFWEQFCHESRVAIQAYLDALEKAGYRVVNSKDWGRNG